MTHSPFSLVPEKQKMKYSSHVPRKIYGFKGRPIKNVVNCAR